MTETTTIQVTKKTHTTLRQKEQYPDEPFESIIQRLLKKKLGA